MNADAPAILVIDDDLGFHQTARLVFRLKGVVTLTAGTAALGLSAAASGHFDLALVDFRLPDGWGTDVIGRLRADYPELPCILISAYLDTSVTVEAMKRGAHDVIGQALTLEQLDAVAALAIERHQFNRSVGASAARALPAPIDADAWRSWLASLDPRSATERLAWLVLHACVSADDPHTMGAWATCSSTNISSLSELCRVLRIHPIDARDLMRVLRVLLRTDGKWPLETALAIRDGRTLAHLFERSGMTTTQTLSVDQFLQRQTFVEAGHPVIAALSAMLGLD